MTNSRIKELEELLSAINSIALMEANYHPIDRQVLDRFLPAILENDLVDFLAFTLNTYDNLFSESLIVCIPEIWKQFNLMALARLLSNLNTRDGLLALVQVFYKYFEISILPQVRDSTGVPVDLKRVVLEELYAMSSTLIKDKFDIEELEEMQFGISKEDMIEVKTALLSKLGFVPAFATEKEICNEIQSILAQL